MSIKDEIVSIIKSEFYDLNETTFHNFLNFQTTIHFTRGICLQKERCLKKIT